MSQWFSAPPKFRCLGLTLLPLTIGHLFLLEEHGLSQNSCPQITSLGDLVFAVFICSVPHESARRAIHSRWLKFAFKLWAWRIGKFDLEMEIEKFEAYFKANNEYPRFKSRIFDGNGKQFGSPWPWRLLTMLMEDLRMSEAVALDVPLIRANRFWATIGDRRGTINLWTEDDSILWEYAKRMDREKFGVKN